MVLLGFTGCATRRAASGIIEKAGFIWARTACLIRFRLIGLRGRLCCSGFIALNRPYAVQSWN